jgi:hypothetical protein
MPTWIIGATEGTWVLEIFYAHFGSTEIGQSFE